MVEEWRFLDTGAKDAYHNMALDEAIATARSRNLVPNTIRFYRWKPSAVSIGYFQSMEEEVDTSACKAMGVDYVRRITGGGAVYHDYNGELTYSIIVSERHKIIPRNILESYGVLCSGLVLGLKILGIPAEFKPINDIVVEDRKISGNAQTRRMGVIQQHGTILRRVDPKLAKTRNIDMVNAARAILAFYGVGKKDIAGVTHEGVEGKIIRIGDDIDGCGKRLVRRIGPYQCDG